jgi:HSP20 family protein
MTCCGDSANKSNKTTAIEQSRTNEVQVPQKTQPAQTAMAQRPQGPIFAPACDIADLGNEYILTADVPGVSAESISVTFEDGVLSIHGSAPVRGPGNGGFLRREYGVGDFQRQFRLGEDVNVEGISAAFEQGVLTVHLPKVEAATPRKVTIKAA